MLQSPATDGTNQCSRCGGARHIHQSDCPTNLHGDVDPFKTCCAICRWPIESNDPRVGDAAKNIYCSLDCYKDGLAELSERGFVVTTDGELVTEAEYEEESDR